jgi:hypothetical protein
MFVVLAAPKQRFMACRRRRAGEKTANATHRRAQSLTLKHLI